jgi:hypothetical protein
VADYPKVKPVTDFVSEMNIVETAFPVQFYDLSTNCSDRMEMECVSGFSL